jgi:hypothetical protein
MKCAFCKVKHAPTDILNHSKQFKTQIEDQLANNALKKMDDVHACPNCDLMGFTQRPGIVKCVECNRKFDCDHTESFCTRLMRFLLCYRDGSSVAWVRQNCKPCPRCRVPIFKDGGCNHVHCSICAVNFCWKCGQDCLTHSRWCSLGILHNYGGSIILPISLLQILLLYFKIFDYGINTKLICGLLQAFSALYVCAIVNYITIQWFTEDVWRFFAAPQGRSKDFLQAFAFSGSMIMAMFSVLWYMVPIIAKIWAMCILIICLAEYRDIRADRINFVTA